MRAVLTFVLNRAGNATRTFIRALLRVFSVGLDACTGLQGDEVFIKHLPLIPTNHCTSRIEITLRA